MREAIKNPIVRRGKRNWNEYNQVLRDRRTDVYAEMLGSNAARGWY